MKTKYLKLLLLVLPFLFMGFLNELVRTTTPKHAYFINKIRTINPDTKNPSYCSWVCHNNTQYCKINHVKLLESNFDLSDPIYFGVINTLNTSGLYAILNLVIFVLFFPLSIYWLLLKNLSLRKQIINLKSQK